MSFWVVNHAPGAIEDQAPPFRVVLTHPHSHFGRRLWRRISGMVGGLLLVLGLTASIPAVPANLAVIAFVVGWLGTDASDPEPFPPQDLPVREIILAWAVATPIAVGGVRLGLRLLRRNRTLVLFLRRFGYDDAQSAITFAVMQTIGRSWRIVSLDDAELAPIGVVAGTRRLFQAGRFTSKHVLVIGHFLGLRMFPYLTTAMWATVTLALLPSAVEFARTGVTSWRTWERAITPFLNIVASVFDGRPPVDAIALSLPGVFAILAMAAAVSFGMLIVTMGALLLAFPLSVVLFFLSSSADAVRDADQSKTVAVNSPDEIDRAARAIAERSRKVFGPRLVVLRVASHVWQHAVTTLASVSSLPLIDVSEPTDNVLWEIEELTRRFGGRCVLIGHYDRVSTLAALPRTGGPATAVERRLAVLLAGREVLAYTSDPPGLRRFAKALRGLLLTQSLMAPMAPAEVDQS